MNRVLSLVIMLCCVLSACGELRGERVVSGAAADSPTTVALGSERGVNEVRSVHGNHAFSFFATELFTGRSVSGAELVADGPVVMSFLVPQCSVCVAAAPDLAVSAAENPDITYVFVHSGASAEDYRAFLDETGLGHGGEQSNNTVHIDDSPGLLWARFGVIQQPTNVLVSHDGAVTQALGALSKPQLDEVAGRLVLR